MKKIAILIRGHTRNYEKIYFNFLQNIIKSSQDIEIKIFIHTWNTSNYNDNTLTDIEKLKLLYNPELIEIENQQDIINEPIFYSNINKDKFKFQLYSIYKLGQMINSYETNNNYKFDYYFHTRFDIL